MVLIVLSQVIRAAPEGCPMATPKQMAPLASPAHFSATPNANLPRGRSVNGLSSYPTAKDSRRLDERKIHRVGRAKPDSAIASLMDPSSLL